MPSVEGPGPDLMFPKRIDNTINSAFAVCPMQAKYAYIDDLSPIGESVHLHFGACFAQGLEVARTQYYMASVSAPLAVEAGVAAATLMYGEFEPPARSPKTRANLAEAIRYYFGAWPLESDSYRPAKMEWRFEVPIPGLIHPDDGGDIMYCGRPDTYGTVSDVMAVEDDKTATSLGEKWGEQWQLDSQFTGYWWAGHELGVLPRGGSNPVLIRGCSILQPKYKMVDCPDGDQVRQVRGKNVYYRNEYLREDSFGHSQVLVYRPQWMIDRWLKQLQRNVGRMIYAYENNEWDLALHKGACAAYGGCSYVPLCMSETPEQWIPVNFVKRKWDPLAVI